MTRRQMLVALGLGLACLSFLVLAQQPTKISVVGLLSTNAPANDPFFEILRESLRDLGYEEGRNISLRIVSAEGQMNRPRPNFFVKRQLPWPSLQINFISDPLRPRKTKRLPSRGFSFRTSCTRSAKDGKPHRMSV